MRLPFKWTKKRLFVSVIFASATFAVSFVLGNAITLAMGPGTSGLFTIIVTTILVVVCARIVGLFGVFTVVVVLFSILAIPTNMFGPPGPQKIVIGFMTGLTYDIVSAIGRNWKYSMPSAAAIATMVSIGLIAWLLVLLNHPRKDYLLAILYWLVPVYGVLGFLGGMLGDAIYNKSLSKLSVVKQFKGEDAPK
jgi:ABC-type thiamin/hydroxymethylpyrimidine transport system permease subunit